MHSSHLIFLFPTSCKVEREEKRNKSFETRQLLHDKPGFVCLPRSSVRFYFCLLMVVVVITPLASSPPSSPLLFSFSSSAPHKPISHSRDRSQTITSWASASSFAAPAAPAAVAAVQLPWLKLKDDLLILCGIVEGREGDKSVGQG